MNRENNLPQNEGGEGTVVIANTPVQKKQTAGEWLEKVAQKWKNHPGSAAAALLVWLAGFLTLAVMVFLVGFIVIRGVRYITPDLFALEYNSENVSLMPAMINTVIMTALSLVIAIPLGVFAAIFLVEYANKGSKVVTVIRLTAETLSGIPSIIYGLFGMLFFSTALRWGYSLLAGSLTLVIMILPLIMRTAEEALLAVPDSYREASFGLGAGKLRTIFRIVLPTAVPGILSGVVLATGRIVGETAALLYTAGSVAQVPHNLFGSGRTLAVHMYVLSSEGLHMNEAYATAVVLLVVVLALNGLSDLLARKLLKGRG
ncbi:MAG TPA: phosphate ABC transporter permease PstA [Candidatus Choladousia intestinavium]|uniref:Phosphate transport system permease protein PstA n=1 Tax=Candidatus Choladousia intestinavium TaxID=2840727 RepID=A0A9D1DAU7_9FIRM|nr:phosphate ABC transporter permease PstA [Candidatus Choladousia intestinavium]